MKIFKLVKKRLKSLILQHRWWFLAIFNILAVIIVSLVIGSVISVSILLDDDLSEKQQLAKFFPILRTVRKASDIIYLPYYFLPSKLPQYQLDIKTKDLEFLNENLPPAYSDELLTDQYKDRVPAILKYDGKKYNVKIRYRGQHSSHWSAPKKSWSIKIKNGEDLIDGKSEFDLILPFDRQYIIQDLANHVAKKLGVMAPASRFVRLKINDMSYGVFWEIEGWSKEMVERGHEASADTDIYAVEWDVKDEDDFNSIGYWKKHIASPVNENDFANLQKLVDVISYESDQKYFDEIGNIINLDNFFKWQVIHLLFESPHGRGANLKLYFNKDIGKFEFISWDVGQLDPPHENFDYNYNILITRLMKNPEFVKMRNQILYDYVNNNNNNNLEEDLSYYDAKYKEIKVDYFKDRNKIKSNIAFAHEVKERRKRYEKTHQDVKDSFKENKVIASIKTNLNQFGSLALLDIQVESFSSVILDGIELEVENTLNHSFSLKEKNGKNIGNLIFDEKTDTYKIKDLNFILSANRDTSTGVVEIVPNSYQFIISSNLNVKDLKIKDIDLKIRNYFSNVKVEPIKREVDGDIFSDFEAINYSIDAFLRQNPIFKKVSQSKISLGPGSLTLDRNTIVPKGLVLEIKPNTTLKFNSQISLVSYSKVEAIGNNDQPIVFTAADQNNPWGVFGVLSEDLEVSKFKNCIFEYGSEAVINGTYFTGQLAIHGSSVEIDTCQFRYAKGDDGLNIKYGGQSKIVNSEFFQNSFDGVDLDWTDGLVESNFFIENGNDALDISGSNVIIKNNIVKDSGDKCVSVGEKSHPIIFNNIITGCNMGIASKDMSGPIIINNVIYENNEGISVYEKKPIFGGAKAVVYNSIIWANKKQIKMDKKSSIIVKYSDVQGGFEGSGNQEIDPKFIENFKLVKDSQLNSLGTNEILKEKNLVDELPNQTPIGLINAL